MKRKINILITASILGLMALSGIQAYLINNTYKLEKDAFIEETKRSIFRFDDNIAEIDSIYETIGDLVINQIIDYKRGLLQKPAFLSDFAKTRDAINSRYIELYQNTFKEQGVSHPVKFQKRLKSIVLLDSVANDTLFFKSTKEQSLHLIGDNFDINSAYGINNSQTTTDTERDYVEDGLQKTINFEFQVVTQDYFNIDGWEQEVLRRMSGILVLSIFIFALVLVLLYYSIKNLITQKKIADIKTDFVNNMTHELKTPLATLTLATKMLKKDDIKQQPQIVDNTIQTIERQNKRLQQLIDQVLNNSLGYQEIQLNKELVDIEAYVNTVLDDFMLSQKSKAIRLNRNFSIQNQKVKLDKFYMTTALLNILENAVKYSDGDVIIDCMVNSTSALNISIKDYGIGISNKDKKQVFDKFFRAGNTEVHDVKGLGLGLYYTNQIVKAHHGQISVESKEGKGTIFTLTIPFH
ncbi:sensor histidine kinase [Winogradskyella sp.]|uniref:sensor histidine kinase n=1 Tax=Winogradskyella sp. TaxID=1883156 RepID=UPI003BAC75D4